MGSKARELPEHDIGCVPLLSARSAKNASQPAKHIYGYILRDIGTTHIEMISSPSPHESSSPP